MKEISTAIILWNCITFMLMGIDKYKASHSKRRISEVTLVGSAFALGAAGSIAGMFIFRHKTKKIKFIVLLPVALIVNIASFIGIYQIFA